MDIQRLSLIWRILIVFLAASIIWWVSGDVNSWVGAEGEYDRTAHIISALLIFSLVLPMVIVARKYLDKRSWMSLRLTSFKEGWKPFVFGGISYLVPALLGMIIFVIFGWTNINVQASFGELLVAVIVLLFLVFMFEALPEELIFRGYFYRNLNNALSKWKAVLTQSGLFVLFALIIGAAPSVDRIVFFLAIGIVIGMIRVITENVWSAVGFHLAFQTMQQMFGNPYNQELTSTTPALMEIVILGIIPFSLAIVTLKLFVKKEPDWKEINPE
ncbi:CPBP family intramembrane metalloprotease [Salicibibacter cibi]|uniref:CPBP family intramembrane metalloprotease n=1 Tax=Salicibibacter cibi TaxID=2743001 RepID=A0A7T6ZAY2_9BACI|nr:CPBP family intramembrane glutamic endopeptidase [Salicibibacter cibi]QQK80154.1 CPBP family intramembrane metalloprotease [Salicibibacter cibi]